MRADFFYHMNLRLVFILALIATVVAILSVRISENTDRIEALERTQQPKGAE